ncbi:DUF3761 domain-containing protein [Acinetobacter sp. ETR1]|uniref:DUF3761 domain-containing protein n=1 Tax=Acinetobacter sp. ETR1 TaxID=1485002 RepID=UPI00068E8564|nr:DUF3761 domain-containing protein [Acinetobacter sp. ETR1]
MQIDPMDTLIKEIDSKPIDSSEKMIGYISVDLAEVFPTPKKTTAINHIERGQKVFIFNTKGDWANISADEIYEYWIDLHHVCFTQNCWAKKTSYSSSNNLENKYSINKKINNSISKTYNSKTTSGKGYVNSNGNYISSPRKSNTKPNGATAKCRDGTWSFSQSTRGTCSRHGGVSSWL